VGRDDALVNFRRPARRVRPPPRRRVISHSCHVGRVAAAEYARRQRHSRTATTDTLRPRHGLVSPSRPGYDLASGSRITQLTGPGGTAGLAYYLCNLGAATQSDGRETGPVDEAQRAARRSRSRVGLCLWGNPDVDGIQVGTLHLSSDDFTVKQRDLDHCNAAARARDITSGRTGPQDGAGPADVIVIPRCAPATRLGQSSSTSTPHRLRHAQRHRVSPQRPGAALPRSPSRVRFHRHTR